MTSRPHQRFINHTQIRWIPTRIQPGLQQQYIKTYNISAPQLSSSASQPNSSKLVAPTKVSPEASKKSRLNEQQKEKQQLKVEPMQTKDWSKFKFYYTSLFTFMFLIIAFLLFLGISLAVKNQKPLQYLVNNQSSSHLQNAGIHQQYSNHGSSHHLKIQESGHYKSSLGHQRKIQHRKQIIENRQSHTFTKY